MGSVEDRCGVRGHGQEPNNIIWDPNHFSNMGPKWDTHVSELYRPSVGSIQLLYFPVVCIYCADTVQFVLKDCITSRYCSD